MNFNNQQGQPLKISNGLKQTVTVTVDPKTNEFIITTENNPSIVFRDFVTKINTFNM